MGRNMVFVIAFLCIGGLAWAQNPTGPDLSDQVAEFLRNRIEAAGVPPNIRVGEQLIHASVMLPRFYERRVYRPAWSDDQGPLPVVEDLIRPIRQADGEGLRPEDYHLARIEKTLAETRENQARKRALNPRRLVDLDLLLTDAFLIYGAHLLSGRINPETIHAEWFAVRREADLAEVLQNALDRREIVAELKSLMPPQDGYARMREALARYRGLAGQGGWTPVPEGPKLQKGDRHERVVALRNRLMVTHDLGADPPEDPELFDENLDQAVHHFQTRHGLDVDGVVGPATLAALNVTASERVQQIEVNMERWRWLPQHLGKRYILVNIANFELDVVEGDELVMDMRVIVGRTYRRTPVFSDRMTYLVLNPYWHVPHSIATQDMLPLIRKDPDYFSKQNIKVFQGWGRDAAQLDPATIDWSKVTARTFGYRFRQEPGPNNALGRVKFMFPNQFNVYLHDTPARELFKRAERGFSSGCIRIEKPLQLAEYVLQGDPRWTSQAIRAALDRRVEQTVRLPEPVPVHLLYWTAWATRDGTIHFRGDIYGRDTPLAEALREAPPGT